MKDSSDHILSIEKAVFNPCRYTEIKGKISNYESSTYQFHKCKAAITVSNKKYIFSCRLRDKVVPYINCMFFRRAIFLQRERNTNYDYAYYLP